MQRPGIQEQKNIDLVGYCSMDKRPIFKMAMQEHGGRWYLYCAHIWHSGWSIVDVTDPANPQLLRWIEGPSNTWTIQMQVAEGKMVTSLEKIGAWIPEERARWWGFREDQPWDEGVLIWDLSDPVDPKPLSHYRTGFLGTHRNFYAGGNYMHLAAEVPGFRRNIYVCVDISDPANPREVSRWWTHGQHEAGGENSDVIGSMHGPAYIVGDRAYLSYGRQGAIILDISDIEKPRFVSQFKIGDFGSMMGVHTFLPIPERKLGIVTTEAILENGRDSANFVAILDLSDESAPRATSILPQPLPSEQAPYDSYTERGGKYGPHNLHMPHHQASAAPVSDLLHLTYFSAGLRCYDIRNPYEPREVGYFVPSDPAERISRPYLPSRLIPQYEDVFVDRRGYAYISDKNYGLTVLKYNPAA